MTNYLLRPSLAEAKTSRFAARIALFGSGLLTLFWVLYFIGLLEPEDTSGVMAQYEAAFPYADALLASTLLIAGIGLIRGSRYGVFCLTGGASMALYLGILDFSFYARQGLYTPLGVEGLIELIINLLCVVGGLAALRCSWRLWGAGS